MRGVTPSLGVPNNFKLSIFAATLNTKNKRRGIRRFPVVIKEGQNYERV